MGWNYTDAVKEHFFNHGATYAGHALGCAAALKVLEVYQEDRLIENAAEQGEYLLERSRWLAERHRSVGDVRGLGAMVAMELVKSVSVAVRIDNSCGSCDGADLRRAFTCVSQTQEEGRGCDSHDEGVKNRSWHPHSVPIPGRHPTWTNLKWVTRYPRPSGASCGVSANSSDGRTALHEYI